MPKSDWYRTKYLKSEHWQSLRLAKLASVDACCYRCRKRDLHNDVHHLRYRSLWDVTLDDLIVVCRSCHDIAHVVLDSYKNGTKEDRRKLAEEMPQIGRLWHVIRRSLPGRRKQPKPPPRKAIAERIRERLRLAFKNPLTRPVFIALDRERFLLDIRNRYLTSRRPCSSCRTSQSPAESAPGPPPRDSFPPIG